MEIVDLTEAHEKSYFLCLEDWSDEMKKSGDHKERWFGRMREKGLRVKLALDQNREPVGMIQYVPIELSHARGKDLYFIQCIWVHGYKEGRGNHQGKGMGTAMLEAAEKDARELGAKGMAAWGISLPFWMKASWFKKHGYKKVDKNSVAVLLWKPFTDDAVPPGWIKEKKRPGKVDGRVTVSAFFDGSCPAQALSFERAKEAASKFSEKVTFQAYDTSDPEVLDEWGIFSAIFIDGKEVRTGPPPSYDKLYKLMAKRVKKL